jgi:uncharacterized protein YdhG (YjbR/CyaY superfamily)
MATSGGIRSISGKGTNHDGTGPRHKEHFQTGREEGGRGPRPERGQGGRGKCRALDAMLEPDRALGEPLHALIKASVPDLSPRLWYGMPAYAKDGKVVCFFQSAQKFKTRYATLGLLHEAHLDEDAMWPVAFALTALTAAEEARIAALVQKAVG